MYEVVIGVDNSPFSDEVLDQGLLAADRNHPVRVVSAWMTSDGRAPRPRSGDSHLALSTSRARAAHTVADDRLHAGLARQDPSRTLLTNAEAREGDPGPVLVRASQDADLLVVGGRRHPHALGTGLGPVTTFVLRHATCPVMVVPNGIALSKAGPRRLVVGVDDSACARSALRWALSEGERRSCPVLAVYVCPNDTPPVAEPMAFDPKLPDYDALMLRWLADHVQEAGGSDDPATVALAVRYGSASAALLFETGPDDILIVGGRGRGGFVGLMLGSVALQCTEHARCNAVVVPTAHQRTDTSCLGWMPSPWAVSL